MSDSSSYRAALACAAAILLVPIGFAACGARASTTGIADDPSMVWVRAPAVFRPGAEMAVIQGDPSKNEPFTVRLRMPGGYVIAPHTHPTDENVTVIDGTFKVGMGADFDESKLVAVPQGGFVSAPALHAHFPAEGEVVAAEHTGAGNDPDRQARATLV